MNFLDAKYNKKIKTSFVFNKKFLLNTCQIRRMNDPVVLALVQRNF